MVCVLSAASAACRWRTAGVRLFGGGAQQKKWREATCRAGFLSLWYCSLASTIMAIPMPSA